MKTARRGAGLRWSLPPILALTLLAALLVIVPSVTSTAVSAEAAAVAKAPNRTVALRAKVNSRYVAAENAGNSPLVANRSVIGPWERFDLIQVSSTEIALRAQVNNRYVAAENAGQSPLISNRTAIASWETFALIRNSDGTVSLRSKPNGKLVTVPSGTSSPLIASRTSIGTRERFEVVELGSTTPTTTQASPTPTQASPTRTTIPAATPPSTTTSVSSTRSSTSNSSTTRTSPSTATSTSAAPPASAGCAGAANTPGGADPWGGCWPGPSNTGIAGCPQLSTQTGTLRVYSGETVENKLIYGQLLINTAGAQNITIRCVKVVDTGYFPVDTERSGLTGPNQILMDRVEVDCQGSQVTNAAFLLYGVTVQRGKVTNCPDAYRYQDYSRVQDSYCGDLNVSGDVNNEWHYDCAQTVGGVNMTLSHNTFSGKDTSDVAIWPDLEPVNNVLVEKNLLIGSPGYKIYVGKGNHPGETNNVTVRDNRFGPGGYGPCVIDGANPSWTGNVWNANGAALPASSCH